MAIQTFIRWLQLFKKTSTTVTHIQKNKARIFLISGYYSPELIPPLLRKYFSEIDTTKTLRDFSVSDIFFQSFRFAGRPAKENLSQKERFKRTLIRYFHSDYERTANIWNLVDLVFSPSPDKCMFIPSAHIVEMFTIHFPNFQVYELSGHTNSVRNRFIYTLAHLSHKRFCDYSQGTVVFANLADAFLLKAYKLLHPNKIIYVRFHDCLDQIAKKKDPEKIRRILNQLIKSRIIQSAETYYEPDAKLLDICYRPNAVNMDVIDKVNINARYYFYTFVGTYKNRSDHSRLNDLQEIRQYLYDLYPSIQRYINEYIIGDFNNERITYPEYLKLIGQSEIIIDMYRVTADEGFSFRIPEALLLERKIITNRSIVLKCDFYDPSRFFVIGYDSPNRLEEFIKGDFKPLSPEIKNRYDCRTWWQS